MDQLSEFDVVIFNHCFDNLKSGFTLLLCLDSNLMHGKYIISTLIIGFLESEMACVKCA